MITLNTKATVTDNSILMLSLPKNLPKGEYDIVIVIEDKVLTSNPINKAVCAGSSASFSVTALNVTMYKWQKNGVDIAGTNSSTFTISSVNPSDTGFYSCVIINQCDTLFSDSAHLTVLLNPLPNVGNDTAVCSGNIVSLNASGGISYS